MKCALLWVGAVCALSGVLSEAAKPQDYFAEVREWWKEDGRPMAPGEVRMLPEEGAPKPPVKLPTLVNTWPFTSATDAGWKLAEEKIKAGEPIHPLDIVERTGNTCEDEQCDHTVGYGGSPDEQGEVTLDAMMMDGDTMDVGSVGCLRNVRPAISVARKVLEATHETLLVGSLATEFAVRMGFKFQSLETNYSNQQHQKWLTNNCEPNFWKPPYSPSQCKKSEAKLEVLGHDTIGVVFVNETGHVGCGCTTNGARNKISGRVGDSPIAGAGSYCDTEVGGAAQTGDGDVMMRFLPTYQAVQNMRAGMAPNVACYEALKPVARKYPKSGGAMVCLNNKGEYGGAYYGSYNFFKFSLRSPTTHNKTVVIAPNDMPHGN